MKYNRPLHLARALLASLLLTACLAKPVQIPAPQADPVGEVTPLVMTNMKVRRAAHTATLLSNGQVLLTGGFQEDGKGHELPITDAELYNPETNTFIPTGALNSARSGHTATRLPDGQVLIVGGWGRANRTANAELYDPATGQFVPTGSLAAERAGMTATLLKNGKVLIAGGEQTSSKPLLVAEIYDPATHSFTATSALNGDRSGHTATLLQNGNVLLIGGKASGDGVLASAELYDPATGVFTFTGNLHSVRHKHAAVGLQDGNVLVVGGSDERDWQGKYASAEIYNVAKGVFVQTAALNSERFKLADAVVLLDNGNILIAGGHRQLELFDAQLQQFTPQQPLQTAYYFATSTLLENGAVLIAGGYNGDIRVTDQAWIYH
ncbi:MAG: hypothetical protein M3Q45_02700 [Chloroflexota bacterium]|nr:hypothetical protein [Chloroflexota bacterium]